MLNYNIDINEAMLTIFQLPKLHQDLKLKLKHMKHQDNVLLGTSQTLWPDLKEFDSSFSTCDSTDVFLFLDARWEQPLLDNKENYLIHCVEKKINSTFL